MLSKSWTALKEWFHNAESIFLARLEVIVGFVVGASGFFDWSPMLTMGVDTGINWTQSLWFGGIMVVKGLVSEWARRRNDPFLGLTADVAKVEAAKKDIKQVKKTVKRASKKIS